MMPLLVMLATSVVIDGTCFDVDFEAIVLPAACTVPPPVCEWDPSLPPDDPLCVPPPVPRTDITITWTVPVDFRVERSKAWWSDPAGAKGDYIFSDTSRAVPGETYMQMEDPPQGECVFIEYYGGGSNLLNDLTTPVQCHNEFYRDLVFGASGPAPVPVTLHWTAPTENECGPANSLPPDDPAWCPPLDDLAGFWAYCNGSKWIIPGADVTVWRVDDSITGPSSCYMTAYDDPGNESAASESVEFNR